MSTTTESQRAWEEKLDELTVRSATGTESAACPNKRRVEAVSAAIASMLETVRRALEDVVTDVAEALEPEDGREVVANADQVLERLRTLRIERDEALADRDHWKSKCLHAEADAEQAVASLQAEIADLRVRLAASVVDIEL